MGPSDSDLAVHRPARRRHQARRVASVLCGALLVFALGTTLALAAHAKRPAPARPVVQAAHNATLSATVVVDSKGQTLYALSGETAHHLKCTTALCLKFWPPLTVASAKTVLRAGAGVHGKLGTLKRPGGLLQVTLRGLPLYRFLGDASAGAASGQLVASFGGVWHAVAAVSGVVTTTPKPETTTSSSTSASTSAPVAPGAPTYPSQTSESASSTASAPGALSSATTTSVAPSVSTSATMTMTTTSSACTPYYVGTYYYPC